MHILLNGYNGNMGQSIKHLLDEFPEITVQDFKLEKINIATQSLVIDFLSVAIPIDIFDPIKIGIVLFALPINSW